MCTSGCTLQHTATHCNTLQHTATHCNTLQHTATHCNTLQHSATHCNTSANKPSILMLPFALNYSLVCLLSLFCVYPSNLSLLSSLPCVPVYPLLQCVAVCCRVLQCVAVCCRVLYKCVPVYPFLCILSSLCTQILSF